MVDEKRRELIKKGIASVIGGIAGLAMLKTAAADWVIKVSGKEHRIGNNVDVDGNITGTNITASATVKGEDGNFTDDLTVGDLGSFAKRHRYHVKRNLTGAVQFQNMGANPNSAWANVSSLSPTNSFTGTAAGENDGWNFVQLPKERLQMFGSIAGTTTFLFMTLTGTARFSINAVPRVTNTSVTGCSTFTGFPAPLFCSVFTTKTYTPAPLSITSAQVSPNTVRNKANANIAGAGGGFWGTVFANNVAVAKKNQKVTSMG